MNNLISTENVTSLNTAWDCMGLHGIKDEYTLFITQAHNR